MAATAAARSLTEAHRLAQARAGADTIRQMRSVWSLLDPVDLDGTFERWYTAARPIIDNQRALSARLASNYLTTFKTLELGPAVTAPVTLAEAATAEQVATSLYVTGPASIKRSMTGDLLLARSTSQAETATARAAMRHVLAGGRDTIARTVDADRQALGWARATSGRPCSFCALLASRGAVYKSEGTADFKAHDGCTCTAEPLYRRDAALPAGSDRWKDLYQQAKTADGDTLTEFRRLVEAA